MMEVAPTTIYDLGIIAVLGTALIASVVIFFRLFTVTHKSFLATIDKCNTTNEALNKRSSDRHAASEGQLIVLLKEVSGHMQQNNIILTEVKEAFQRDMESTTQLKKTVEEAEKKTTDRLDTVSTTLITISEALVKLKSVHEDTDSRLFKRIENIERQLEKILNEISDKQNDRNKSESEDNHEAATSNPAGKPAAPAAGTGTASQPA